MGCKIEHSIIYDLWIMIYDLHFAAQRYNKKTRFTRKKYIFFVYVRRFSVKMQKNANFFSLRNDKLMINA